MGKKAETGIVEDILEWIVFSRGTGYHVHGSSMQRSGEPDVDGSVYSYDLHDFVHLKLEVKTATGKPTELQKYRLRIYHMNGYCAGVVTSVEETKELIKDWVAWRMANPRYLSVYEGNSFADHLRKEGKDDIYNLYGLMDTSEGDG